MLTARIMLSPLAMRPFLVLLLALPGMATVAQTEDAKAALAKLPGLAAAAGRELTDEGGFLTTRLDTPAGAVTIRMINVPRGGWMAVVQPPAKALNASTFGPAIAAEVIGDGSCGPLTLFVSTVDCTLDTKLLPESLRSAYGATAMQMKAGANLMLDLRPGRSGLLAQVRQAIGAGDQPVRISGTCGPEFATRLLGGGGTEAAMNCNFIASFAASTPPAFAGIDQGAFSLRFDGTRIRFGHQEGVLRISGDQRVIITILGRELAVANSLSFSKNGENYGIACSGTIDLADDLLSTRAIGFDLKRLLLSGDLAASGSRIAGFGMGIGADVEVAGVGRIQGDFAIVIVSKAVNEISLALRTAPGTGISLGSLPVIKSLPGADQFAFTELGVGVSPANREAFLHGTVVWPKQQIVAQAAVLLANGKTGPAVALFFTSDGLTLRKLCPTLPAQLDVVPLNRALVAISTAPIADRTPAMLPSPVRAMLAAISERTDGRFTFSDGVTIVTSFSPDPQVAEGMKALGLGRDPMVLAGSVGGVFAGDPSFALYADLGRLPIPAGGRPGCIAVKQVTPRFFIAARDLARSPALDLGCHFLADLRLGGDQLALGMKSYITVGQAGAGVRVTGTMDGIWKDMLGISGFDIGNLVVAIGADADGSGRLGLGGQAAFNGLTYAGQGLVAVTPVGVPKQFGMALRGDRFGPGVMLRMMEGFVRSTAAGPLASTITDEKMRRNLAALASTPSLAETMGKTLPLDLLEVRGAKVFLATPGASDPDLPALSGMGIGVAGTLIIDGRINAARTDCFITESQGLRISGQLADVDLGLVALKNTNLDVRLPMPLQGTPYFKMRGDSRVLLYEGGLDIEFSAARAKFVCRNDWGAFGKANIRAETLGGTLTKPKDFILELEATADIERGIRTQLAPTITAELRELGAAEQMAYDAAKADLATLEKQLAATRIEAGKNKADTESAITAAQRNLEKWGDRLDDIDDDIDEVKDDIESAKDKVQLDKVVEYGLKLTALETKRAGFKTSYLAAKAVLAEAKKATKVVPINIYPEVVAAQALVDAKRAEVESLTAAKSANDTLLALAKAISDGAKDIPLAVEELSFRNGRLSSAAAGRPQLLRLRLRLTQPGREPVLLDGTLAMNLLKPAETDLKPLARALRDAIVAADRMAKTAAADKELAERKRTKPKRKKK
jgi:hypothetical protein